MKKLALLTLGSLLLMAFVPQPPEKGNLEFNVSPMNSYWLKGADEGEFYLHLHVKAPKMQAQAKERLPLNISVVIDKSGSMSGDKIAYTKKAVNYLIDQLGHADKFSLVQYSDEVHVLCNPTLVESRDQLKQQVNRIVADGYTNLSGGMERGFQLLSGYRPQQYTKPMARTNQWQDDSFSPNAAREVKRVFLLSDGLANRGATTTPGITSIVDRYFQNAGVGISTFGVGSDYNEDLMAAIANHGGGNYQFIESPERIPELFAQELLGVSNTVARNTTLRLSFPWELKCEEVMLYPFQEENNVVEIKLGDLISEGQRSVLIRFKAGREVTEDLDFSATLTYNDVMAEDQLTNQTVPVHVELTESSKTYQSGFNKEASEGYALLTGGQLLEKAMAAADKRDFKTAEQYLSKALVAVEDHFARFEAHPFLKKLHADMKAYGDVLKDLQKTTDQKAFRMKQKGSKHKMYRAASCPAF